MEFSVLIPVYHKENPAFFRDALNSIWENQTLKPNEVVIVKDGPITEDLNSIIVEFSSIAPTKIVELKQNMGLGIALSEGVKACSYPIIARMDSDDVSRSDRFQIQVDFLASHPEYDAVSSNIAEFNQKIEEIVSFRKLPKDSEAIIKWSKRRNPLNHMAVIFKKNAVLDAGNYVRCKGYEDYFLWARMIQNGSSLYNIQENLIFARVGNGMLARRQGVSFFYEELKFQSELYRLGFLNLFIFCTNLILRAIPRLFPIWGLKIIYKIIRK